MNSILKGSLIALAALGLGAGVSVGVYFGTVGLPEHVEPTPVEHDPDAEALFAAYSPKSASVKTDASSEYINKVAVVVLGDETNGYYYELTSDKGFSGSVKFAIGIKDGSVIAYKFLANVDEDDLGAGQAQSVKDVFVTYNGEADVMASMTTKATYYAMKKAVDAALADASNRENGGGTTYAHESDAAETLFASDALGSLAFTDDFSGNSYINAGAAVALKDDSVSAFYYELQSGKGFDGSLKFAIGVENGVVTKYKFISNIDENELGYNAAKSSKNVFVGYSLASGGGDVLTGTTITYNSMKLAVDAALTDVASRTAYHGSGQSTLPPASDDVLTIFNSAKTSEAIEVTGEYFIKAEKVTLADASVKAFYYQLKSAKGFDGQLKFAIGIENGTVTGYKFLSNIDENELGYNAAKSSKTVFVGYTTEGGGDVLVGATYTYNSMKLAVDAALADAATR